MWLNIIFRIKYKNSYSILILNINLLRFRLIILGSIRFMVDHSIQILSKCVKKTQINQQNSRNVNQNKYFLIILVFQI